MKRLSLFELLELWKTYRNGLMFTGGVTFSEFVDPREAYNRGVDDVAKELEKNNIAVSVIDAVRSVKDTKKYVEVSHAEY